VSYKKWIKWIKNYNWQEIKRHLLLPGMENSKEWKKKSNYISNNKSWTTLNAETLWHPLWRTGIHRHIMTFVNHRSYAFLHLFFSIVKESPRSLPLPADKFPLLWLVLWNSKFEVSSWFINQSASSLQGQGIPHPFYPTACSLHSTQRKYAVTAP
jgi:hypothetical protein